MTTTPSAAAIDSSNFKKFFIGGQWVRPSTGGVIQVVLATTEEVLFRVAEAPGSLAGGLCMLTGQV